MSESAIVIILGFPLGMTQAGPVYDVTGYWDIVLTKVASGESPVQFLPVCFHTVLHLEGKPQIIRLCIQQLAPVLLRTVSQGIHRYHATVSIQIMLPDELFRQMDIDSGYEIVNIPFQELIFKDIIVNDYTVKGMTKVFQACFKAVMHPPRINLTSVKDIKNTIQFPVLC